MTFYIIDIKYFSSVVKDLPANAGDAGDTGSIPIGSIPGSERSPGEENDNLLQYSCLGNLMDKDAWWAAVQEITKELDTT